MTYEDYPQNRKYLIWDVLSHDISAFFFFFCLFAFSRTVPTAYEGSQARGLIGTVVAGLGHSHGNEGSEPHLGPTPQLMAMLDP